MPVSMPVQAAKAPKMEDTGAPAGSVAPIAASTIPGEGSESTSNVSPTQTVPPVTIPSGIGAGSDGPASDRMMPNSNAGQDHSAMVLPKELIHDPVKLEQSLDWLQMRLEKLAIAV